MIFFRDVLAAVQLAGNGGPGSDSFVMSLEPAIAAKSSGTILQADGIADRVCGIGISRLFAEVERFAFGLTSSLHLAQRRM